MAIGKEKKSLETPKGKNMETPKGKNLETPEGAPVEAQELDQQTQAYLGAMMKMLHDPASSPSIVQTLQESPPEDAIPALALTLNDNFEQQLRRQGQTPELKTLLIAGTYLVADLVEIGNAAGAFELGEAEIPMLLQSTMQQYIERGLKQGTIDPVELQEAVEPLMGEEHRNAGIMEAESSGIPLQANQQTAMSMYGMQRERAAKQRATQKVAEERRGAMQGPPQGQGGA